MWRVLLLDSGPVYVEYSVKLKNNISLNVWKKCKKKMFFLLQENIDPSPYSLSPVSAKSQKLLRSPRKATRKISRIPFKVNINRLSYNLFSITICVAINILYKIPTLV